MNTCPYEPPDAHRPCQGALYREIQVTIGSKAEDPAGGIEGTMWEFPYAAAMNQECDLDQDHANRGLLDGAEGEKSERGQKTTHDKLLLGVLLCPAYRAADLRAGEHLARLERKMQSHSSGPWKLIKSNQNPRYHFLAEWPPLQVPELVLDFKHFFTMPAEMLRSRYGNAEHYFARLGQLYREDLSQRFAAYLARIGLPTPHHQVTSGT